ncbi:unnamed protein product [Pseudo-nitzschia multistriata]|uniref:Uncharacterized protein n=1 Tax=Pseudo-nitzschia multistriata TaxID=183589 RepID=A0A448ZLV2_9STRA|nr:unnamed protein product [Pseudo-nitzschia multistriata]
MLRLDPSRSQTTSIEDTTLARVAADQKMATEVHSRTAAEADERSCERPPSLAAVLSLVSPPGSGSGSSRRGSRSSSSTVPPTACGIERSRGRISDRTTMSRPGMTSIGNARVMVTARHMRPTMRSGSFSSKSRRMSVASGVRGRSRKAHDHVQGHREPGRRSEPPADAGRGRILQLVVDGQYVVVADETGDEEREGVQEVPPGLGEEREVCVPRVAPAGAAVALDAAKDDAASQDQQREHGRQAAVLECRQPAERAKGRHQQDDREHGQVAPQPTPRQPQPRGNGVVQGLHHVPEEDGVPHGPEEAHEDHQAHREDIGPGSKGLAGDRLEGIPPGPRGVGPALVHGGRHQRLEAKLRDDPGQEQHQRAHQKVARLLKGHGQREAPSPHHRRQYVEAGRGDRSDANVVALAADRLGGIRGGGVGLLVRGGVNGTPSVRNYGIASFCGIVVDGRGFRHGFSNKDKEILVDVAGDSQRVVDVKGRHGNHRGGPLHRVVKVAHRELHLQVVHELVKQRDVGSLHPGVLDPQLPPLVRNDVQRCGGHHRALYREGKPWQHADLQVDCPVDKQGRMRLCGAKEKTGVSRIPLHPHHKRHTRTFARQRFGRDALSDPAHPRSRRGLRVEGKAVLGNVLVLLSHGDPDGLKKRARPKELRARVAQVPFPAAIGRRVLGGVQGLQLGHKIDHDVLFFPGAVGPPVRDARQEQEFLLEGGADGHVLLPLVHRDLLELGGEIARVVVRGRAVVRVVVPNDGRPGGHRAAAGNERRSEREPRCRGSRQ